MLPYIGLMLPGILLCIPGYITKIVIFERRNKMTRLFKSFIAVSMAAMMILSASACSDKGSGTVSGTTTAAASGQAGKDSEPVEINWVSATYNPINDDAILKRKIEKDFNLKINVVFIDQNSYTDVMGLKFASGEVPDYFWAPSVELYQKWAKDGLLSEITNDELKEHSPLIVSETDKVADKYNKYIWTNTMVDGKCYSFPSLWMAGKYHDPVIWRTDWLKNVGIEKIPVTLDEAEAAFYKFAKEDPDKNGKKDTYGLSASGLNALWGASGYIPFYWSDKGGKLVYGALQPEVKEMVARFAKWYKDGVLDPEYVTGENQGGYWAVSHAFANGKIGLTCMGYYYHWWKDGANRNAFSEIQKTGTFDCGQPLAGATGKSGMASTGVFANAYNCFRAGIEKEKMYKVLETVNGMNKDKDTYLAYSTGEKGVHWDLNADGVPEIKEEWKKQNAELGAGNTFFQWNNPARDEEGWIMSATNNKWVNDNFTHPSYINAVFVTLPSASLLKADADKVFDETMTKIITGKADINEWDGMIEKISASCYNQLTKEANEWYSTISK